MSTLGPERDKPAKYITLSTEQKKHLLLVARQAIESAVSGQNLPMAEDVDPAFRRKAAVFVTLWRRRDTKSEHEESRELRGCIGRIRADQPLDQAVFEAAIGAAMRDPRFSPVLPDELDQITIEIAILSPMQPVHTVDEINVGEDGLVIEAMGRRGLLLPKVATRFAWNRAEFVGHVCLKAGLPADTWPAYGQLYRFQATDICE